MILKKTVAGTLDDPLNAFVQFKFLRPRSPQYLFRVIVCILSFSEQQSIAKALVLPHILFLYLILGLFNLDFLTA